MVVMLLVGLLDMSAMFDTVDQTFLLTRLNMSHGVVGQSFEWLCSFPDGWTIGVTNSLDNSVWTPVKIYVLQGQF